MKDVLKIFDYENYPNYGLCNVYGSVYNVVYPIGTLISVSYTFMHYVSINIEHFY